MYSEVSISCIKSETNLQDQHSEKYRIKWDNSFDDKKTLYSDNLDDLAFQVWAGVLTCILPFCDDPSHHR